MCTFEFFTGDMQFLYNLHFIQSCQNSINVKQFSNTTNNSDLILTHQLDMNCSK